MRVTGLDRFGLNAASFRRLGNPEVRAWVSLRTYDVTPAVKRLPPSKRLAYMAARVDRWMENFYRLYPMLSFQAKYGKFSDRGVRRWSQLPSSLTVKGPARRVSALADATGVSLVYVERIAGLRRHRSPKSALKWYCVRAFVVICVERAESGLQNTEDRFLLIRASSFEDAKQRLKKRWREYATRYLNSNGQMVSWQLDRISDVYDTCETEIDPNGTEVYSKLGHRRMRSEYIWRP